MDGRIVRWVALVALGFCAGAGAAPPPVFAAGAARIDITPPVGYPLWGYAARKDQPSTGIRDPLQARALVLAAGPDRIALVSLDLGRAPPRAVTASLRRRLKDAIGLEHFFLVASHTHHGPILELDDWPAKAPYVKQLEQQLFDVIVRADKARKPARFGVGSKEVNLNRNRHSKRPDRPEDRELLVLRVEDLDGKPIAHVVNFAAHAILRDAKDRQISADWPGVLAASIEKDHDVPCLFLQGAAGDLSPNPRKDRSVESYARDVTDEVQDVLRKVRCKALTTAALPAVEEDFTFPARLDLGNPFVHTALSAAFFPALVSFYEREYRPGLRPHLTAALLDGRIGFVGVSGEFFCGHSLALKRRARLDHVFFLGYCNDYHQYFPTIEAASEGGYGTEPYLASAEIGAGERIVDRALIHLYKMRNKVK